MNGFNPKNHSKTPPPPQLYMDSVAKPFRFLPTQISFQASRYFFVSTKK